MAVKGKSSTVAYSAELEQACKSNNLADAKCLVKAGASLAQENWNGWTPLLFACQSADPSRAALVEWILSRADGRRTLDRKSKWGDTALIAAARYGNGAIARLLLHSGADAEATSISGKAALDWAVEMEHADIAAAIEEGKTRACERGRGRDHFPSRRVSKTLFACVALRVRTREEDAEAPELRTSCPAAESTKDQVRM